ncbi:MAG: phosphotransferase [Ornithinimicrobium sp.]
MLLLEDLAAAREGDALAGAAVDDVTAVLESMIPLWRYPSAGASVAKLPRWGSDPQARQARFVRNWADQRDILAAELPPDIWQTADRLSTSLAQVAAELARSPSRVVHADLHLDNVLFADEGPILLDWGSTCAGSPAVDIFLFISSSLPPQDQQRHGRDLLADLGVGSAGFDDWRRRLLCALAGVVGWRNRPPTGNPREQALREASLSDGRLIHALRQWDATRALP